MTLLYTAPLGRQQHRNGVDHKFDHHSVPLCSALHHNQHVLHVPNRQQRNGWCQAIVSAQEPAFDEPSTPPDTPAAVPDNDWVARDTLQLVEGNYEWLLPYIMDEAPAHHDFINALRDTVLTQQQALALAQSYPDDDDVHALTAALLCLGVRRIRSSVFPTAIATMCDTLRCNPAAVLRHKIAILWCLSRVRPAHVKDPGRVMAGVALKDVGAALAQYTQQQLQQLSVVPPITIVLLLSAMSRFKVQPSSAMLDTVAVYCRDAGALRHTNTEALLLLLKSGQCFADIKPSLFHIVVDELQHRIQVQWGVRNGPLDGAGGKKGDERGVDSTKEENHSVHEKKGEGSGSDTGAAVSLKQLSEAVWILGRVSNHTPREFLLTSKSIILHHIHNLSPNDIVYCMHGLVRGSIDTRSIMAPLWGQLMHDDQWKQCSSKQLTVALWCASVTKYRPETAHIQAMTDTLLPRVSKADMSMLCMLSIIACRMDVGGATEQLLGMLDDAFTRRIRRAQYGWELAVVAQSYARLQRHRAALLELLAARAVVLAGDMLPKDMLRLVLAFSALGFHSDALLDALDQNIDRRMEHMQPGQLSMSLWAMAKEEGVPSVRVIQRAEEACVRNVGGFTPGQIAVVAWAFARLQHQPATPIMERVVDVVATHATTMNPKAVANAMWALGKLEYQPHAAAQQRIEEQLTAILPSLAPQGLANVLWGLARWKHTPRSSFWNAAETALKNTAAALEPAGLSAILWSMGTLQHSQPSLLSLLVGVLPQQLPQLPPRELANTLWGFGRLTYRLPDSLLETAYTQVSKYLSEFTAQELFNVLWSLAKMRIHPPTTLLDDIATEMGQRCSTLNPQELVNTVWSFARMHHSTPSVHSMLLAMQPHIEKQCHAYKPRYVVTLLWSLAQLRQEPMGLMEVLCGQLPRCCRVSKDVVMALVGLGELRNHPGEVLLGEMDGCLAGALEDALGGGGGRGGVGGGKRGGGWGGVGQVRGAAGEKNGRMGGENKGGEHGQPDEERERAGATRNPSSAGGQLRIFEVSQALYAYACLGYVPRKMLNVLEDNIQWFTQQMATRKAAQDACRSYTALVLLNTHPDLIHAASGALREVQRAYGTHDDLLADTYLALLVAKTRMLPSLYVQRLLFKACREAWMAQEHARVNTTTMLLSSHAFHHLHDAPASQCPPLPTPLTKSLTVPSSSFQPMWDLQDMPLAVPAYWVVGQHDGQHNGQHNDDSQAVPQRPTRPGRMQLMVNVLTDTDMTHGSVCQWTGQARGRHEVLRGRAESVAVADVSTTGEDGLRNGEKHVATKGDDDITSPRDSGAAVVY